MPIALAKPGTDLWQQVIAKLAADIDQNFGLVPALGNGANSVYPNFESTGPSDKRELCPCPFILVYDGGKRATDRMNREARVHIEVHDDPNLGEQRRPGIIARIYQVLVISEWRPTGDNLRKYLSGLSFESESMAVPDDRYLTSAVQLTLVCTRTADRTSGRGYNG